MKIKELFKVVILGIIEGISEWLPISSSGHLLLIDEFLKLDASDKFKEQFFIFIQLGAIFAVILHFFKRLFPFSYDKKIKIRKDVLNIWGKVIVSCIPGVVAVLTLGNYIDKYLETPFVISLMLFIYGIIFILIEIINKNREYRVNDVNLLTYKDAFYIGLFQVLSLIPGTSRSGATIVGALLIGVNRTVASEFTFFLSIPVMAGMSFYKLFEFGIAFTFNEIILLTIGMLVSFGVSALIIKTLMKYVKNHDFKIFGVYRIILAILLLIYLV